MASPVVVQASTFQKDDANATSFEVTRPAGLTNGNLLLFIFACDGDRTIGMSSIGPSSALSTNTVSCAAAWLEVDGSETTTYTVTTSGAERACAVVYEISGSVTASLTISGQNTGASATPDPLVSATGASDDYLYVAIAAIDRDRTVDSFPSNMDTGTSPQNVDGGGANSCSLGTQTHQETGTSFNPGTFGISASDGWTAGVIQIGTPGGGGGGRIMGKLASSGGLAGAGGIAGSSGGLAG
jgi:hypothetical protein